MKKELVFESNAESITVFVNKIKNLTILDWVSVLNCIAMASFFVVLPAGSEMNLRLLTYIGILLSILPFIFSLKIKKERNSLKVYSFIFGIILWGLSLILIYF
jgi:hypothetical protein